MKILVSEIPDEGLDIDREEDIGAVTNAVAPKAVLHVRAERIGSEVRLKGSIEAALNLQCSRCLKPFRTDISASVDLVFMPPAEAVDEEKYELASDELNTGFYREDEIDLGEISAEQVLLNVPMKPLCSEACRGICPLCGTDLNVEDCGCKAERVDDRMAALKKYLEDRKEQ